MAPDMTNTADTAEHLRNALDGRFRDVKNDMRKKLNLEIFRPHYTPNTVIARAKVAEQMQLLAAAGAPKTAFARSMAAPATWARRSR